MRICSALCLGAVVVASPAHAQTGAQSLPRSTSRGEFSAAQLFALADAARDRGEYRAAEVAYRALTGDPDPDLRNEARFRLAMMLADKEQRLRDAAVELRRILDEKPKTARVRLELARINAMLGDMAGARRELRAVQASPLPPDVEQLVRFYANALNARKTLGGSIEMAIAPDTNVNRATRSDTLGTVIGDFTLDEDARARSGVGLALRGQSYARLGIDRDVGVLVRASAAGTLYRQSQFADIALALQAGPEIRSGDDRISLSAGPGWRWYGMKPYNISYGVSGDLLHPLGKRAQLRVGASATRIDNRFNDLQDGDAFTLSLGLDRAFSARFGGGVQVSGVRTTARDPGYADATIGVSAYLFREIGRTTLVASTAYSHLEADARLFLYPQRRRDDRFSGSIGATFRSLTVRSFAPFARLSAERNKSTAGIYSFGRVAAEFGLTSAF